MQYVDYKSYRFVMRLGAFISALAAFATYLLTTESGVAFWDCPEYVASSAMLEPGHPPGNPMYMLVARVAMIFAPGAEYYALAANIMSALFSALAVGLLFLSAGWCAERLLRVRRGADVPLKLMPAIVAASGVAAMAFAWCDTFWFSAVEAEVYSFASFCTALLIWIMLCWFDCTDRARADRLMILAAYVAGCSIGVHELNLLVIPALAFIVAYRVRRRISPLATVGILLLSFAVVGIILRGLMSGTLAAASFFELLCVNDLHLPIHSGVLVYAGLLLISAVAMLCSLSSLSRVLKITLVTTFLVISGIYCINGNVFVMLILAAATVAALTLPKRFPQRVVQVAAWSVAMLMLGFSSYSIIIIRGAACPPMNQGAPGDIFAFRAYLEREQYGSHPLLRGRTPYSELMKQERIEIDSAGNVSADYSSVYRGKGAPRYVRSIPGGKLESRRGKLSPADSVRNADLAKRENVYILAEYKPEYRTTPELDIWFPRIFSPNPNHIRAYESWAGMSPGAMESVPISYAVDSLGNPVERLSDDGQSREHRTGLRPTIGQNLRFFGGYQVYYMYLRYLLWNFVGRQNDRASQGELDNGNMITGIAQLDNAMLGRQELRPASEASDNPGRNVYWLLPLVLGIAGIVFQLRSGREGRRQFVVVLTLFVMTGVAIVIYLNQTPGEPRERDYSFAGSLYAFAVWIGLGALWIITAVQRLTARSRKYVRRAAVGAAILITAAVPVLMAVENWDDHDRSGRSATTDSALNALVSLPADAILFTNGDNYIFPLWYAQEVLGVRPDVRVVNIAYLSTPWYVRQMLVRQRASAPLPAQGTEADYAYGRIRSVSFPSAGDTIDAIAALRELYATPAGSPLRFPSPLLKAGDAVIDLRRASEGKTYLTAASLFTLDVVATTLAEGKERPLCWFPKATTADKLGMDSLMLSGPWADRLSMQPESKTDLMRFYRFFTDKARWLGADREDVYIDELAGEQITLMRRRMISLARRLLDAGHTRKALEIADLCLTRLPRSVWPMQVHLQNKFPVAEGAELARIYRDASIRNADPALRVRALGLLRDEVASLAPDYRFYQSLTPSQRRVLTPAAKLRRIAFCRVLKEYIEAGGAIPTAAIEGIDTRTAIEAWRKDSLERTKLLDL